MVLVSLLFWCPIVLLVLTVLWMDEPRSDHRRRSAEQLAYGLQGI